MPDGLVLHERQLEPSTELGHRWFDLMRKTNADAVMNNMTAFQGDRWQTTDPLCQYKMLTFGRIKT